MELTKLYDEMKNFSDTMKTASDTFQQTKKKLREDFGNGKVYDQRLAEVKKAYEDAAEEAKQKGLQTVEQEFSKLNEKIQAAVVKSVPADFVPTLEAIKATGKSLTKQEAELYIDKFSDNYTAYRSLISVLDALHICKVYPVTYDSIKADFDKCYSLANGFFRRTIGDYMTMLLMAESNPIRKFDESISYFLKGNLLAYGVSISEDVEAAE